MKEKVSSIKSFLSSKMYNHDKVKSMTQNAHKIITSLFELFMNADDMIYSKYLPNYENENHKSRMICDFVAGMTDNFAQTIYNKHIN